MPVIRTGKGFKVEGAKTTFKTKKEAEEQLKAIKANQAEEKTAGRKPNKFREKSSDPTKIKIKSRMV